MKRHYQPHGKRYTRLYGVWKDMKTRCYNPHYDAYYRYGGRGITVCDEWKTDFQKFYDWSMLNGYDESANHGKCTLDRKDNNGGYSPDNCRWITAKEQSYNRSTNHLITYNGETHTIVEWANLMGLKKNTLIARVSRGWSIERALTTK